MMIQQMHGMNIVNIQRKSEKMDLLREVTNVIDDVRARDIVCFDMKGISPFYNYVIICSGNTERQTNAIMNHLKEFCHEMNIKMRVEGKESGRWILVDIGDIIINVFMPEEREYFQLEKLWFDAPKVDVNTLIDNRDV